jgi:ribose 5-phosphate isomerase A
VPVEVLAFGAQSTRRRLEQFGSIRLRERDGRPFVTDSGNCIFDIEAGVLEAPGELDCALRAIPGVVETGLFVGRADVVVVAGPSGVRRLERPRAAAT